MDSLRDSMVQMRHDAVEEIKDGWRQRIYELFHDLNEKYILTDRQTEQSVHWGQCDLMQPIRDSDWYEHEILELLKRNEDDALEQMAWIAEPDCAPEGCAPGDRFLSANPPYLLPAFCLPVGRDKNIEMIGELGKSLLAQEAVLRRVFEYLQNVPAVTNQETAVQEAQSIAKVKHLLHTQWVGEARKAQDIYMLLMRGRGSGVDDQAMVKLQQQVAGMDLS